jgi:hypothetical protein
MEKLDFREFMGSTGVVFNSKIRPGPHSDWNYVGAPGRVAVSPKEGPIKHWLKPKKRKRRKHDR